MVTKNNTYHRPTTPFFDIIDERKSPSIHTFSIDFLSEIPESLIPIDKINTNPRLANSNYNKTSINYSHVHIIAQNRQHKFENRINWHQGVKDNEEQQTLLNEQQIKLETQKKEELDHKMKKDIENKLKNIGDLRKKLNKERMLLDKMQKEDKRSIAIEELFAIRKDQTHNEKYVSKKTTKLPNQTERSA